jgi:dihydroxy-acid dehydratase
LGGPIAKVQDDDEIEFDLLKGTIAVKADLDARKAEPVEVSHPFGYLADFAATVSQAHEGCVPKWTLKRSGCQRKQAPRNSAAILVRTST